MNTRLNARDYVDMMGASSRLLGEQVQLDPKTFDKPGIVPRYVEFRRSTIMLNVAKLLTLQNQYPGLEDLWASMMSGRHAENTINCLAGKELEHLIGIPRAGYMRRGHEI